MEKWKQHLGVYGIYAHNDKLLVVRKARGPYINRFDLPGGSFDENESISDCLIRELKEEIGHSFAPVKLLGTYDYLIPWKVKDYTHLHHLAIYFEVKLTEEFSKKNVVANDTSGYELIDIKNLTELNSSPLVIEAVNILKANKVSYSLRRFDDWETI